MMLLPSGRSNSDVHPMQAAAAAASAAAAAQKSPFLTRGSSPQLSVRGNANATTQNGFAYGQAPSPLAATKSAAEAAATTTTMATTTTSGSGPANMLSGSSVGNQSVGGNGIANGSGGSGGGSSAIDRLTSVYQTLLNASASVSSGNNSSTSNSNSPCGSGAAVSTVLGNAGNWQDIDRHLNLIQCRLKDGWTVHVGKDGRLYYCNHLTQTAGWLPSCEDWSKQEELPYGWERAIDTKGRSYYINHLNKTSTYEAPECVRWEEQQPPEPRVCVLQRSTTLGFGFVAGSERPVIVRFVTDGGPSMHKLQPGDQILAVNGEDVKEAPRDHVIQLVRACDSQVALLVCQPVHNLAPGRKSTLLSAGKRAKLRTRPSRVRFAESVCVNGAPLFPPSAFSLGDICVPPMANVLKVFLENGQTKSFKYDSTTTVRDVVSSLLDKLCLNGGDIFSLVLEHVKSLKRNKLTLLDPEESLARIAARPGAHKLRCLFRVTFVPISAAELAQKDLNGLDYFYMQCCNDVTQERFAPELQPEVALRLAALHMHQHALANNISPTKLTVKVVEREFGLERFVPITLFEGMKRKELRRLISHFLKLNAEMTGSSSKSLTQLQAKLHYLDIIASLPSYGAKCFSTNQREGVERVLLVSPRFGLSQISSMRNSVPQPISGIEDFTHVIVQREDDVSCSVNIFMHGDRAVKFNMEDRDGCEFSLVLAGYYRLLTGKELHVQREREQYDEDHAPSFLTQHTVLPAAWSYLLPYANRAHSMNFLMSPPYHPLKASASATPQLSEQRKAPPQSLRDDQQCDRNMNSANVLDAYKKSQLHKASSPFINAADLDMHSVMATELLEEAKDSGLSDSSGGGSSAYCERPSVTAAKNASNRALLEARNEEVLRRVQEMQKMVENSEQYLNEQGELVNEYEDGAAGSNGFQGMTTAPDTPSGGSIGIGVAMLEFDSDCDSLNSSKVSSTEDTPQPGALKHSDSLVLLAEAINQDLSGITKGLNAIGGGSQPDMKLGMPALSAANSPRPERKFNGFGQLLSNLQALGTDFSQSESDSESINSPTNSPTMRRPPLLAIDGGGGAARKQNAAYRTSFGLHSPDGSNFGAETKDYNLREYLKQLKEISNVETDEAAKKLSQIYGFEIREDTFIETDADLIDLRAIPPPQTPDELDALSLLNAAPHGFGDCTARRSGGPDGDSNGELDRFLAKVVVAPPTQKATPAKELTPEEIMSFIIPPPPNLDETDRAAGKASTAPATPAAGSSAAAKYAETECLYSNSITEKRDFFNRFQRSADQHTFKYPSSEAVMRPPQPAQQPQQQGHVIEYATVERKSKFSCCPKSRKESLGDGDADSGRAPPLSLRPPPRSQSGDKSPPVRPPKSAELQQRFSPKKQQLIAATVHSPLLPQRQPMHSERSAPQQPQPLGGERPPQLPPRLSPTSSVGQPKLPMADAERGSSPTVSCVAPPKKPPLPPLASRPILRVPLPLPPANPAPVNLSPQPPALQPRPSMHTATSTNNTIHQHHQHHHHYNHQQQQQQQQLAAHSNGHCRSNSDCPPAGLPSPLPEKRPQLSLLCSPQMARKVTHSAGPLPPTSPLPSCKYIIKNGHVIDGEALLAKTDIAMAGLLVKLDQVAAQCSAAQAAGGGASIDEDKFQRARNELTDQTLVLVTASKFLVVAMSDATLSTLPEHLTSCLTAIRRITELTQDMTRHTSAPLQTRNIVLKVHDVASNFRELVGVQIGPLGAGQLALQAECLANVLATLLRSLRVFSP